MMNGGIENMPALSIEGEELAVDLVLNEGGFH